MGKVGEQVKILIDVEKIVRDEEIGALAAGAASAGRREPDWASSMASEDVLPLADADYRFVASLMYSRFGIQLGNAKRVLVAGRLTKRVRQLGLESFAEYFDFLRADASGNELSEFINRLTTNHSFFNRERDHFEFLRKEVLPAIKRKARPRSRRQSAHVERGLRSRGGGLHPRHLPARLLRARPSTAPTSASSPPTSRSPRSRRPRPGSTRRRSCRSCRSRRRRRASARSGRSSSRCRRRSSGWSSSRGSTSMADSYPFKSSFDVVFCRNVMIYFDQESRSRLVRAFHRYVKPGGYFFIGHSETILRADCPFEYVSPAIYRKAGA